MANGGAWDIPIWGLVARAEVLRQATRGLQHVCVIGLPQGFAFLATNDDVLGDLRALLARSPEASGALDNPPPDWDWKACPMLSPEEVQLARWLSRQAPVAWVETDYFGGHGFQSAAAWVDGEAVLGPLKTGAETPHPDGAINRALRCLGVVCGAGKDEFDAVGLGWHRDNEEWISQGRRV